MAELPRPGVEVIQQFTTATPTSITPTLVPFVTGPAKEIIEFLNSDGSINTGAKQGTYDQLPQVIAQSAFPSPRGNIAEVNVEEATIKTALLFGGKLSQLDRDPGSAFLVAWNNAGRATFRTPEITPSGLTLDGKTLVIAIDQTVRANTLSDEAITFATVGGGNLSAQQIADQINTAVGEVVASVVAATGSNNRVQIASNIWGAGSSVTIRAGGSANSLLVALSDSVEYRVEAAGFYAQDQSDNTTISAYIAWSRGNQFNNGVITAFSTAGTSAGSIGQLFLDSNGNTNYVEAQASAITFTGGGSINLQVGDYFFADGIRPNTSAEVSRVETNRFKLGIINTQLSTFDDDGVLLTAVYDDSKVNTLLSSVPFAPRNAWFRARKITGVNVAASAATMTGAKVGVPATVATIVGTSVSGPFALAGLTLKIDVTIDNIAQDTFTFTFTGGPFADMAAVVAAIGANIPHVAATNDGGLLRLSTTSTGAGQTLVLDVGSSAASVLGYSSLPISDSGTDVQFQSMAPVLTSSVHTFPFTATAAQTVVVKLSSDGGTTFPTTRTFTWPVSVGPFADVSALLGALNTATSWDGSTLPTQFTVSSSGSNKIVITSASTGDLAAIKIDSTSTGITGATNGKLQFISNQTDTGENDLSGLIFKFRLDDRPDIYTIVFQDDSLDDAVAEINHVVGFTVASIGGSLSSQIVLTSPLDGMASKIEIVNDGVNTHAFQAFGFTAGQTATGVGRPNPDFMVDDSGNVVIGGEILRNAVTGQPFGNSVAALYIQYTGLRLDVSPRAAHPALLSISDTVTLGTVLGPINEDNPLGLGMFFQILSAPGIACKGMGVAEATAGEPEGSLVAYSEVASFLQSEEVYAICPLTSSQTVHEMFGVHVNFMSGASQKGERILIECPLDPLRDNNSIISSGLSANTTATPNQLLVDENPSQGLVDKGINPALIIPQTADVFVELQIITGASQETRRYNVQSVNGVLLTFRTAFTGAFNIDGFYTTTPLTETLLDADWSMEVRGAPLLIPGSTLLDKDKVAATVAARSTSVKNRRIISIFPDTVVATIDGSDQEIQSYYYGAALTGMTAANPPQQGFTQLPSTGFTGVKGSQDTFSTQQLDTMAGGGTYIIVQDVQGGPVISRHQLTTDLTSIETREYSITKVVDFVAKFMRTGLRNYIGTFNVTQPFLDMLSTVIQGQLSFLEDGGVILGGDLNNLIQDKANPDTVLVDITLDVPFPCNYIRLTLSI